MAVSRRSFVTSAALGLAGCGLTTASDSEATTIVPAAARVRTVPAAPVGGHPELLLVGPGKQYPSLTLAGCRLQQKWTAASGQSVPDPQPAHIIISPAEPGYYTNDSGSHSRRWPKMVGWPPYEGALYGPIVIEGEPGKPPPVLDTDGYGDGVLYYQTGLFATGNFDATFRNLIFRGFRRQDGIGNYAAVRLGQKLTTSVPMQSHVLFEDCEISQCDNAIMGGISGQSLTLRRVYLHDNGNGSGRCHNVYFGGGDVFTMDNCLSTRCTIGHLAKSRAAKTVILNTRLLGRGGTESACLDVPDAGVLSITNAIMEKSPGTDANWIVHYSGENQDGNDIPFHVPSSVDIDGLVMVAPPRMINHPSWGEIVGFSNQSGAGDAVCGKGSFLVRPNAKNVKAYGLKPATVGLPCTFLPDPPKLDAASPVKMVVASR
ncbi:right-handed parallel beta-helix repeat-containing protein [Acidisphaera sp. S103]|uniref:right-handed parallel beta-helix repeat-containing protein n=1 Tax=Acidisphaera sp. S103 TaxID=1747223 RepID=UPI00131B93CD|nr:right-handed parallel beta-helix repeat-containing protein [Acidisphaera sp. S103]